MKTSQRNPKERNSKMKKERICTFKGIAVGVVATLLLANIPAVFALTGTKALNAAYKDIKIVVDGNVVTPTDANGNIVEPFIVDGTTYLPLRAAVNAITGGAKSVEWDQGTSTIYIGSRTGNGGAGTSPSVPQTPATSGTGQVVDISTLTPYISNLFGGFVSKGQFVNRQQTYTVANMLVPVNHVDLDINNNSSHSSDSEKIVYLLDKRYKSLNFSVAFKDNYISKSGAGSEAILFFSVDEQNKSSLLAKVEVIAGEKPADVSIDLTGVDKFQINFSLVYKENPVDNQKSYDTRFAFYDAKLIAL
jgi:hypothetical protein